MASKPQVQDAPKPAPSLMYIDDWVALRPRAQDKYLVAAFAFECRTHGPAWATEQEFESLFAAYKQL